MLAFKDGYGCTYGVFKLLVVRLDVKSLNEVFNLTALYIFYIFVFLL